MCNSSVGYLFFFLNNLFLGNLFLGNLFLGNLFLGYFFLGYFFLGNLFLGCLFLWSFFYCHLSALLKRLKEMNLLLQQTDYLCVF